MDSHFMNFIKSNMGYTYATSKPYDVIDACEAWFYNEPVDGFHNRKTVQGEPYELDRTNMAKRGCEDDANLCEIVNILSQGNEPVIDALYNNQFDTMIREQLEYASATGTAGAYPRYVNADVYDDGTIRGGQIDVTYCDASGIIPLTVKNGDVVDCAFTGIDYIDAELVFTLVAFVKEFDGNYTRREVVWNKEWRMVSDETYMMGDTKPFALLVNAGVNNVKGMPGFGVPKVWNATSFLKGVDLAWNFFSRDLAKADKLLFMNETLFDFDSEGNPVKKKHGQLDKQLFCFLGEKLPSEGDVIQEYNPMVRVDDATKAMELSLSMLSNMFGFGTKKYTFENGQILTASQYIGERQDSMQELNKQRANVSQYIIDLLQAISWYMNEYDGGSYAIDIKNTTIDYDDSYITDRASQIEQLYQQYIATDIDSIGIKWLMLQFSCDEEEAKKMLEDEMLKEDPPNTGEGD